MLFHKRNLELISLTAAYLLVIFAMDCLVEARNMP